MGELDSLCYKAAVPIFWAPGTGLMNTIFPRTRSGGDSLRMIQVLHLLCTLILLLLHQLCLRSPGIRSWRQGTSAVKTAIYWSQIFQQSTNNKSYIYVVIRHTGRNAQAGIWELNTGALTSAFQADEMCTWEGHKSGIRRESLRNCHDVLQFACLIQKLIFTRKERTCLSMSSLFSSSVHFSQSVVSNCLWPHGLQHARLPCPPPRVCSKLKLIESVMPSNCLILCLPLLLLPSIFPSIRLFSSELPLFIRWPKYWSFSFSISPSNGYSGLISFRIDWFDLLAVQGTLTILKHQSFSAQPSSWSNSHIHTWLLEKPWLWLDGPLLAK